MHHTTAAIKHLAALAGVALFGMCGLVFIGNPVKSTALITGSVLELRLDEGSGTTAMDSSGNGNAATLVNGPVWTTGKNGGGMSLDGVNDNLSISNSASLNV